jgi:6-phosphogluconate dehydrogenase
MSREIFEYDYCVEKRRYEMQIGMIGLGRMGSNMVRRLLQGGHACLVYDRRAEAFKSLQKEGAIGSDSLDDFVARMTAPRAIWLMVPATAVDEVLAQLVPLLETGDIVIDGGNSYYRDDIWRAARLQNNGVHYVDVGTSGGVVGLERGYCLMIGGEKDIFQHLEPVFATLAPGVGTASRTLGRLKPDSTAEQGYLLCGPHGAGHFVKMVHNGIEYGLMAAYAEGLNILRSANIGNRTHDSDAETAPMRAPEFYQYDLDLPEIAEVWRRGSVVASWLLDLTAEALVEDAELAEFSGRVSDSGEGRWTLLAAIEEGVPTPVISAALFERFASRGNDDYAARLLSAMRKQFGGHDEKKEGS